MLWWLGFMSSSLQVDSSYHVQQRLRDSYLEEASEAILSET